MNNKNNLELEDEIKKKYASRDKKKKKKMKMDSANVRSLHKIIKGLVTRALS